MSFDIVDVAKDKTRINENIGSTPEKSKLFKLYRVEVDLIQQPITIHSQNIGDAFILSHSTNGKLGVANGVGGGQITLGRGSIGIKTLIRVLNANDTFYEVLRNTDFVDTTNTTATVSITNHNISFSALGQSFYSNEIFMNSKTITQAKLIISSSNISGTGTLTYYLSADNGTNWEEVELNTYHIFTNTGNILKYKITNLGGSNVINIEDSNNLSTPIVIEYIYD